MRARSGLALMPLFFSFLGAPVLATTSASAPGSTQSVVQSIQVLDVGERDYNGRNALSVVLSAPVDTRQDLQAWLEVLEQDQLVAGGWVADKTGRVLWFNHTEPDSEYQVTVRAGLPAADGSVLQDSSQSTVKTRSLTAGASFVSDGLYLTPGQGLPIQAVNVPEVNIDFLQVSPEQEQEFFRLADQSGRQRWYLNDLSRMTTLVHSDRYQLDAEKNTRSRRLIDLNQIKALKPAGLYLAVMTAPGLYQNEQYTWFRVTDMGIHARAYKDHLSLFANSLKQGTPFAAARVELLDSKQRVLAETETDAEGRATLPWNASDNKAVAVRVRWQQQEARLRLNRPALDLSEFAINERPWQPQTLFIYGPRSLYRAGEILDLAALLRDQDGRTQPPVSLPVRILRPDGSEAGRFSWQPQAGGYYQQQWLIPANAPTGRWQVEVDGPFDTPVRYSFQVEDFMPERMRLLFGDGRSEPQTVGAGQDWDVDLLGEYLYGAPADGNRVEMKYRVTPWRSPVASLPGFEFGDVDQSSQRAWQTLKALKLDAQGKGAVQLEASKFNHPSPMRLSLLGSLFESGGRAINRQHDALYWPADQMLGIKPAFGDANPPADSRVSFELARSDLKGVLSSGEVDLKLVREERNYFWSYNSQRGWHYAWSDSEYPVHTQRVMLNAEAPVKVTLPVEWGNYRLEVGQIESGLHSTLRFHAGEDWYSAWQQSQTQAAVKPDQVDLVLDRKGYEAGEMAKVRVTPPHKGALLMMLESGDELLWYQRIEADPAGTTVEVPVPDAARHDLYLSALALRPAGSREQAITPARAMGLVHLPLDREKRKLSVAFDLPEKVEPAQTLTVPVQLGGGTTQTERWLTLAAVDSGILSLNRFATPDPFKAMFGPRRYGVEARDMYHRVVEAESSAWARQRFGGDADLTAGGAAANADVKIVSLFSGPVKVDAEGRAEIPLTLPWFNGELRLMAVAFDSENVGSAEQTLKVASPVVSQLASPRFMAFGDQALAVLELRNQSEKVQALKVDMSAEGAVSLINGQRTLELAPGERTQLTFVISARKEAADQLMDGALHLQLSGDGIRTQDRSWQLPVRAAWPVLSSGYFHVLNTGDSLPLQSPILDNAVPGSRRARLQVSSSIQLPVQSQLDKLMDYPYRCLEQTLSRAMPLLITDSRKLSPQDEQQQIVQALARLAELQRDNGSFGLWSNRSPEEPLLTVYAADFMLQAREQGVAVSEAMLSSALKRLRFYLSSSRGPVRWSESVEHYRFSYRAYAAWVLARQQSAPLSQLRSLYKRSADDARSPVPLMHMALAFQLMGDSRLAADAAVRSLRTERSSEYLGDYGGDEPDMALQIALLSEMDGDYAAEIAELAVQLRDRLPQRSWLSTQTRSALVAAGAALANHQGKPWQLTLNVDGTDTVVEGEGRWQEYLDSVALDTAIKLTNPGDLPLFVDLAVQGLPGSAPPAESKGMDLRRLYYGLDGKPRGLKHIRSGELVLVELLLESDQRTPDAMVIDLIPAGFELENPALANAVSLDGVRLDGEKQSVAQLIAQNAPQWQAFRDDRFVAAVDLHQDSPRRLFYLMRAVTPGSYQIAPPLMESMYQPERRATGSGAGRVEIVAPDSPAQ